MQVAAILIVNLGSQLSVWVGHSCPTPLTLVLNLKLRLHVWDGH